MVGIFTYGFGLRLVAVSSNREKAIKELLNRFGSKADKELYAKNPILWYEENQKNCNGVPHCYEIVEVEEW